MSALSNLQDTFDTIKEKAAAYVVHQQDIASQIRAIDPKSEDAQAQLDAIMNGSDYEQLKAENAELGSLTKTFNSLKAAAYAENPSATDALNAQLLTLIRSVTPLVTNAKNETQAAITNAKNEAAVAQNESTGEPNKNDINDTPASDDASYDKSEAARLANYSSPTADGNEKTDILTKASTSATQAGSAGSGTGFTNKTVGKDTKPGSRLQNPLGNFASYTYQLSLYMITPDAYDAFVLSGKKNINALSAVDANGKSTGGGAFLVAQSGGINNKTSQRAPGFDLDFYIDDLKIKTATNGKETRTSSNVTDMSFTITEPMGFSFITKLKRASDAIKKNSKLPNYDKSTNASKQFFILGIRFQGYDKNGEIANASQYFSDDTFNTSPDASGVYERFYDIIIKSMKFKLNGGATTYQITAASIGTTVGMGVAKGIVDNNVPVVADTVMNALGPEVSDPAQVSLLGTINDNQKKMKDAGDIEIANVYKIEWLGEQSDLIKSAILKSDADKDKKKSQMSDATNSSQVNDATATKAIVDTSNVLYSIPKGTPIPQAIKNIIMHSSYLESAMNTLFTTAEETDPKTDAPAEITKKNPPPLRWYNLSTRIKCLGFDTKVNNFAYEITYVIQPYDTPAAVSPYGKTSKYYGPHKKYNYWFTGKNSEIISYEQTFDNTFFNVALTPNGDPQAQGAGANIPTEGNKQTNQERTGRIGDGNEAQNTYMTSLFDPGAYAKMKMTILGDPDYLTQETPDSVSDVYRQFYKNDGFTINPNGGQVFIEISFNEGVDYDNGTGLLTVNDSIYFWNYPPEVAAKIKGVSYMLTTVESVFSKGKFTQTLEGNINDIPAGTTTATPAKSSANGTDTPNQSAAETNRLAKAGSVATTGLTPDAPVGVSTEPPNLSTITDQSAAETARLARLGATQQTTPTNNPATPQVQDDDSSTNAGETQAGAAMSEEDARRAGA